MCQENEKYERNNTGKLFLVQNLWGNRLGRNVWTQDNSPHIKLTLRQLAPDSETNSPNVVISHHVLKYAGKIINVLKLYSPQLDINLPDRFFFFFFFFNRRQQLSLCRVAALKCLPVHRYSVVIFHFLVF